MLTWLSAISSPKGWFAGGVLLLGAFSFAAERASSQLFAAQNYVLVLVIIMILTSGVALCSAYLHRI